MPAPSLAPPITDATRREFLALLGAAGLLAGCGAPTSSAPAPSASTSWTGGPHGPVDVPRDPQRVVVGNAVDADFALVLGLPLVGAPGAIGYPGSPFADYHAAALAGVAKVATGGEPNFEEVAALRPDLVLDSWDAEESRYARFSGIAPTVNFTPVLYPGDFSGTDWPAALTALAALFGRESRATEAIGAYRDAVAAARARIVGAQGLTYAPVNAFGAEGVGVIDAGQQVAKVAADLGLRPHPLVAASPAERVALSLEELGRLAGVDVLLIAEYPAEGSLDRDRSTLDPVTTSPLWGQLPAVVAGRVVTYPGEIYYASPLTAPAMVTTLADGLAALAG